MHQICYEQNLHAFPITHFFSPVDHKPIFLKVGSLRVKEGSKQNKTKGPNHDLVDLDLNFCWSFDFVKISVCVYVCVCPCVSSRKTSFPVDWKLLVKEHIANIGIPKDFFFLDTMIIGNLKICHFLCLQTSLLCIMGELAGGGSMAKAIDIRDMWHMTCDHYRWQMTHDMSGSVYFFFCIGATICTCKEL